MNMHIHHLNAHINAHAHYNAILPRSEFPSSTSTTTLLSTPLASDVSLSSSSGTTDHRLLVTGLVLGLFGAVAIAFIIYKTFRMKDKTPYAVEAEEAPPNSLMHGGRVVPMQASLRDGDRKGKVEGEGQLEDGERKGGGGGLKKSKSFTLGAMELVGKCKGAVVDKNHIASKITPFGSPAGDGPRFVHRPGENMRIATRLSNGIWEFSDPQRGPLTPSTPQHPSTPYSNPFEMPPTTPTSANPFLTRRSEDENPQNPFANPPSSSSASTFSSPHSIAAPAPTLPHLRPRPIPARQGTRGTIYTLSSAIVPAGIRELDEDIKRAKPVPVFESEVMRRGMRGVMGAGEEMSSWEGGEGLDGEVGGNGDDGRGVRGKKQRAGSISSGMLLGVTGPVGPTPKGMERSWSGSDLSHSSTRSHSPFDIEGEGDLDGDGTLSIAPSNTHTHTQESFFVGYGYGGATYVGGSSSRPSFETAYTSTTNGAI